MPASNDPPSEPSDETLLARVADGGETEARAALEALYDRHARAVLRLVAHVIDDAAAEDVLQDVFVLVATHARDFRGESARGWLLAIAGNRARELLRLRRRRDARERTAAALTQQSKAPSGAGERHDEVANLLAQLPGTRRLVLELRLAQGLRFAEVATVLGVSLRTAKNWVAEALARLRRASEQQP